MRLVRVVVAEAPPSRRGAACSLLCGLCRDDLRLGLRLGEFLSRLGLNGVEGVAAEVSFAAWSSGVSVVSDRWTTAKSARSER